MTIVHKQSINTRNIIDINTHVQIERIKYNKRMLGTEGGSTCFHVLQGNVRFSDAASFYGTKDESCSDCLKSGSCVRDSLRCSGSPAGRNTTCCILAARAVRRELIRSLAQGENSL